MEFRKWLKDTFNPNVVGGKEEEQRKNEEKEKKKEEKKVVRKRKEKFCELCNKNPATITLSGGCRIGETEKSEMFICDECDKLKGEYLWGEIGLKSEIFKATFMCWGVYEQDINEPDKMKFRTKYMKPISTTISYNVPEYLKCGVCDKQVPFLDLCKKDDKYYCKECYNKVVLKRDKDKEKK
jgi:protein-arginine kinase activator protein McsA